MFLRCRFHVGPSDCEQNLRTCRIRTAGRTKISVVGRISQRASIKGKHELFSASDPLPDVLRQRHTADSECTHDYATTFEKTPTSGKGPVALLCCSTGSVSSHENLTGHGKKDSEDLRPECMRDERVKMVKKFFKWSRRSQNSQLHVS